MADPMKKLLKNLAILSRVDFRRASPGIIILAMRMCLHHASYSAPIQNWKRTPIKDEMNDSKALAFYTEGRINATRKTGVLIVVCHETRSHLFPAARLRG